MTDRHPSHAVLRQLTDAHGRPVNFTPSGQASTYACPCSGHARACSGRLWGKVAVAVAAVLTAGLVLSVLLMVIRDVIVTVAGTSMTGLLLRALLPSSVRRER